MKAPTPSMVALAALLCSGPGAAAGHCQPDERAVFSCLLRNGKTVSVCASRTFDADGSYLQYRYGRLGKIELEYPAVRQASLLHFDFESHRPYQGEYENLGFSKDGYRYGVYRVLTNEPGQKSRAGIEVFRVNADRIAPVVDTTCSAPLIPPAMGLEAILKEP